MIRALLLLLLWLALAALPAGAQDVLPVPALSARVIDQTASLAPDRVAALEARLAAFEAEAGPQIVVLVVGSTAPEDIGAFTQRVGDAWKIGRREVGDGLLLVVAKDDRRVRIAPAKALEGAIPDLAARQIIERAIAPAFRAGDYAGGIEAAVEQLIARIRGEDLPAPDRGDRGARGGDFENLPIFLFVVVPVVGGVATAVLGRKLGTLATAGASGGIVWWLTASALLAAGAALAAVLLVGVFGIGSAARSIARGRRGRHGGPPVIFGSGGGGWGGGWSGGGGGGFGSGGGGDFGGGGASGDW